MRAPQRGRNRSRRTAGVALLLIGVVLSLAIAPAGAELVVGGQGSGAGQIANPRGVAVDPTLSQLYVSDRLNERVDVFDADTGAFVLAFGSGVADGASKQGQICTTTCFAGFAETGAGEFDGPRALAVDNDPSSASFHSVYVVDSNNSRVQKFSPAGAFILAIGDGVNDTTGGDVCTAASGDVCGPGESGEGEGQFTTIGGIGVGSGGVVYVADHVGTGTARKTRIQKYSAEGAYLEQLLLTVAGGAGATNGFSVDPSGNLIVGTSGGNGTGAVRKYDPAGALLWTRDPSFNIASVATDSAGNVFVGDRVTAAAIPDAATILEFDSAGNQLRAIFGSLQALANIPGLAPYESANGDIFAAEFIAGTTTQRVVQLDFPPAGPYVYGRVGANFADGISNVKAVAHAEVDPEGKATTYHFEYVDDEHFAEDGWSSSAVKSTPESGSIGSDFALHAASAEITNLTPETVYHFRAVATNSDAPGGNPGPEATFETKPPLEFGQIWVSSVGTEAATLNGEIDPVGIAATGFFEYVDEATFEASGFDEALEVPAVGSGASPLDFGSGEGPVARNAMAAGLAPGTVYHYRLIGNDHCKPEEPSVVCRFESPEGTFMTLPSPVPPATSCQGNAPFRKGAAAFLPDCRGYEMVSPVDKHGVDIETASNIEGNPATLDQSAAAGSSITYSASRAFGEPVSAPYSSQYLARRSSLGWESESISPQREGPTLYNTKGLDFQFKAFTADLCLGWPLQDTAKPVLAPGAVSGFPNLYRRDNCEPGMGQYEAITTVAPPNLEENEFFPELQGISSDGSKTFFRLADKLTDNAGEGVFQVYESEAGQLTPICLRPDDTPAEYDCSLGTPSAFGIERDARVATAVSEDGGVAYWSENSPSGRALYVRVDNQNTYLVSSGSSGDAEFWFASSDGMKAVYTVKEQLFEFDLASKSSTSIATGARGVAGGSDDLSKLYFVSTKNLATGATLNQPNLYFREGTTIRFVATLTTTDVEENWLSPAARRPSLRTSRITPSGNRIVFMSTGRPTGYDNTDASSGKADAEVFLFDAEANGGSGRLSCISCNPTGARPVGEPWKIHGSHDLPVSGNLNVWENQLYAPRVISDDGNRVFFNSFDALVGRDTNDRQDVYEWEAPGSGDCDESSPAFVVGAAGCLSLLSSGESSRHSGFLDASTSGDDAFFKTSSSLVAQDPGLLDIYVARVGGGFADPPPQPEECEGEACQPVTPAPGGTVAGSEAVGPGNPVTPAPKPRPKHCPRGKHKVKKHGKTRCVKNHRKHGKHKHRKGARRGRAAA